MFIHTKYFPNDSICKIIIIIILLHWTLTVVSVLMMPSLEAATQVYVLVFRMLVNISTFLPEVFEMVIITDCSWKKVLEGQNPPMGTASSGVRSFTPWRHLTKGIGLPTATQVMLRLPPFFTCFGFHCFYFSTGSTVSTAASSVIISVIAQIFINVITRNGKKSISDCIIIIIASSLS